MLVSLLLATLAWAFITLDQIRTDQQSEEQWEIK